MVWPTLAADALKSAAAAAASWAEYARQADNLRQEIRVIPPGSRVLVAEPPANVCPSSNAEDRLRGLTPFVVIDRRALVSTLFTGRGKQPVWILDPRMNDTPWLKVRAPWFARHDGAEGRPNWRDAYDTLIALHVGCAWRPELPELTTVAETADATVYRLR
jgi:hypothetical protein